MKTCLVTVSDDRMGRKNGQYLETQRRIVDLFCNPIMKARINFDVQHHVTIKDIFKTTFYQNNKALLDNVDPARNGRVYKPFVIREALAKLDEGDMVVYTDCSPEMWNGMRGATSWANLPDCGTCDLKNLYDLCQFNEGILTHFVRWDTRDISIEELGIHTHRNFTTDLCFKTMLMPEIYKDSYQHASGMFVIIKSKETMEFMEEWLYYNCDDRCACLGRADIPGDYSYWTDVEDRYKMGHRHDQSISGLLMNGRNRSLIRIRDYQLPHPYLFLNLCYPRSDKFSYEFVNSNTISNQIRFIRKGDTVINENGQVLTVFDIWNENGQEVYIVGFHRQSAYKTTEDKIKRL